jgi:hypothetical protein
VNLPGTHAHSVITKPTAWSVGASVRLADTAGNHAIISLGDGQTGSSGDPNRQTIAYRSSSNQWGVWNGTDSWLFSGVAPAVNTNFRINFTHNTTVARSLYVNGGNVATDSVVGQFPGGTGDYMFIGVESERNIENMNGELGFVYLRSGILSAQWIAAEHANTNSPGTFYSVGAQEAL